MWLCPTIISDLTYLQYHDSAFEMDMTHMRVVHRNTKTHGVLSKVKKYLYFVCLMSYFKHFLELKAKPILLIPMELHDQLESLTRLYVHALHTHISVLELYWDAEPILSQALWGSPDRGGIYNNKNKFCSYPVFTEALSKWGDTLLYDVTDTGHVQTT